jgi:GntR family transcriptional regulator
LIYTVTGKGCFVTDLSASEMLQKRNEMILKQMAVDVSYYKSFGLAIEEVFALLKEVY